MKQWPTKQNNGFVFRQCYKRAAMDPNDESMKEVQKKQTGKKTVSP